MKKLTAKELQTIVTYHNNINALCNFIENICNDEYERGYSDGFTCGYDFSLSEMNNEDE